MISTHDTVWDDIQTHLELEKRAATQEIRNYPQPIAGCDAQIPALWERRDSLVEALSRLAELSNHGSADALADFVESCSRLSAADKQKFMDRIRTHQAHAAAE